MIKKTEAGYVLLSQDGTKHLGGPYRTHAEAVRREKQVEYFKQADASPRPGESAGRKPKRPTERQTTEARAERRARELAAADDARSAIRQEESIRIERARDALKRGGR